VLLPASFGTTMVAAGLDSGCSSGGQDVERMDSGPSMGTLNLSDGTGHPKLEEGVSVTPPSIYCPYLQGLKDLIYLNSKKNDVFSVSCT
jgi:hypothetical protein